MSARDFAATAPPRIGLLDAGPLDAITDVAGVTVGHATLADGPVQTGVTGLPPHAHEPCLPKEHALATAVKRVCLVHGLLLR